MIHAKHMPIVGRAITGKASGSDLRTIEALGYIATMKDGRKVVTLPIRDEYFRRISRDTLLRRLSRREGV